jgi:hypothetical protein
MGVDHARRIEALADSILECGLDPAHPATDQRFAAGERLKSVFAKTDTHRQAELVALLGRLALPS